MKLCQTHYNKFIINEAHKLKHNEVCSHPKHDEYKSQSKNINQKSKQLNLVKVPKRLISVLQLDENAKICSLCRKRTDNDPDYNVLEEYNAPILKKNDDDNILKIGNHTYSFRKDILYNGEELKQFESDYQEIIAQLTVSNEISLSNKIKKMSSILYKNQRLLKQKTIYDPDEFKNILEIADADLIGFFDELYEGTNPANKSEKTNNNNKKKLVSLCYFLASINNKYINGIKVEIGSYLQTSGASATSIDTLANLGLSVTRKTVDRKKKIISDEHEQSVDNYCLQNMEKIFILNIDDYHNIHRRTKPSLLETHNIFHFVTILLNSNSNIPRIPYCSNNILIHNPKGIDPKLIIEKFENHFMNQIGKSYYEQNELWKQFLIKDSYENRVENLNVHNYDGRIQKHQELRSLNNSKLVDFILHPLHSTKDYIESSNILFKVFERLENTEYLDHYVIPIIADWPGQVNIRRAITLRINKEIASGISEQILSLIPLIGPLHISLNSRETLFQTYHFFFEMLYHDLFGDKKVLSQKPKQTVINLILDLTFNGWKNIRDVIIHRFGNSKDAEYRMMIDLLDNSIPLTLDIYAVLFRSGYFEGYLESVVRVWVLFQRLRRHNYNKAPLVFLSDVFYWELNNHPMANTLKNNLPIFNDYFVENFHSSIRSQTVESNSALQIIQKAKIIDAERNNNSFKESFINSRNPIISQDKLNYLEKKVSLFLFSLFDKIYHNIGNTNQINNSKYPSFILPSFEINVDVKVLSLAWNTEHKLANDKFCDAETCLLSNNIDSSNGIVLICGHGFHKECLTLYNGKCNHCFNYLSFGVQKNISALTTRLTTPLKDNEIPLVEEETNDSLDENNDENMQSILERLEQNIDNQFEILYQQWADYKSL
ncbi:hypothetical protein RhiirA4_513897 [Rhizophagus irregularis]|uniref:RING-type domain-containing protein n=1 Tax=Rhizophagus irregularis TaxID=588596 RepID=A0A2I1HJ73_9GLOM|nr:hypothetical protein RhiirA4_513897 [Rhizophagus irregularis]